MSNTQETNPSEIRPFCVWFASGADPDQLHNTADCIQLQQDMLVVEATNDHDALVKAAGLLRDKCEFDSFITRVFDRTELLRMLEVLDRVDAGKLPPATDLDLDHHVWVERYLSPPGSFPFPELPTPPRSE